MIGNLEKLGRNYAPLPVYRYHTLLYYRVSPFLGFNDSPFLPRLYTLLNDSPIHRFPLSSSPQRINASTPLHSSKRFTDSTIKHFPTIPPFTTHHSPFTFVTDSPITHHPLPITCIFPTTHHSPFYHRFPLSSTPQRINASTPLHSSKRFTDSTIHHLLITPHPLPLTCIFPCFSPIFPLLLSSCCFML